MVKARLVRVQNSHMVAKTAVQVDIPDFEARSKGAARAGDYAYVVKSMSKACL